MLTYCARFVNGSRNKIHGTRHTVILIHHGSVSVVGARGDRLRPVSAEFRGSLLDSLLRGGSWLGELSCERVWWTVTAGSVEVEWRHAGGALVQPHPEAERCRR